MSAHELLWQLVNAPFVVQDPGDGKTIGIIQDRTEVPIVTATTETRTLAAPDRSGVLCKLVCKTYGGAATVTVLDSAGSTTYTIAFGAAGYWVLLHSIQVGTTYKWQVLQAYGVTGVTSSLTGAASVTSLTATAAVNTVNMAATNANATTVIATTSNATNSTVTTLNATTAGLTNATVSQLQITATPVAAAGTVITNAGNLSYGMNLVNSTDNTKGVILPVAVANSVVDVFQTVNAKSLNIYPQVNSAIAGLGANTALNTGVANTTATGGTAQNVWFRFIAANTTQWYVTK